MSVDAPNRRSDPPADELALRAELIDRARSLVPLLRRNADEAEKARRLPDENVDAMTEAGMFRLQTPRRYGGLEVGLRTYLDVTAELARGCGSSSWYGFILNMTDWILGTMPEAAQDVVWQTGPDTKLVSQLNPMPGADVRLVEDGVLLSGRWGFASACLHATWTMLGYPIIDEVGNVVDFGVGLVPMDEITINDTWFVAGMAGTGSHTLAVQDVFVPTARTTRLSLALAHNYPTEHPDEYVFQTSAAPTYHLAPLPPVLGLAQAALDTTLERLCGGKAKPISYTFYMDVTRAPSSQHLIAQAATMVDAAFLQARAVADELDAQSRSGRDMPPLDRARSHMRCANAVRLCREATDLLLNVQGAGAFALSNPMQRIWRDLNTASRHGLLNPEIGHEVYGRALFGADEQQMTPFL